MQIKKQTSGSITILVATFNGSERIEKTLSALSKLIIDGISFVELLVIDNASNDDTITRVEEIWTALNSPFRLRILKEKEPGKIHALQKGLKNINSEFVLICDDDNSLFPDYVQIGLYYLQNHKQIGILGGHGMLAPDIEKPEWFNKYSYYYACAPQAPKTGNVFPTRNVVYGAGMFLRKKAYDTAIELGFEFILSNRKGSSVSGGGEDGELCWAIKMLGYEIWYIDEMKFYHQIPLSRLTEDFRKKMIKGMSTNSLYANSYLRIWNRQIPDSISYFWLKELCYSIVYILLLPFKKNGISDFNRSKTFILGLIRERSTYDKKIRAIQLYIERCCKKKDC